jgi:hypothetical protein
VGTGCRATSLQRIPGFAIPRAQGWHEVGRQRKNFGFGAFQRYLMATIRTTKTVATAISISVQCPIRDSHCAPTDTMIAPNAAAMA